MHSGEYNLLPKSTVIKKIEKKKVGLATPKDTSKSKDVGCIQ